MIDKPESYVSVTQGSIERSRIEELQEECIRFVARKIRSFGYADCAENGIRFAFDWLASHERLKLGKE